MKLSRLYTNKPNEFAPIEFNDGLSAILAEIRLPENQDVNTHNLGKSTFGEVLDFCLLRKKQPQFFLFRYPNLFSAYTFYLEIALAGGDFLTVRRPVTPGSKVDFLIRTAPTQDAAAVPDEEWDHLNVPFERARSLLVGILGIESLKDPGSFRKLVGYLIRGQNDYQDVFQLDKFRGKQSDWKPFVAQILGVDKDLATDLYAKKDQVEDSEAKLKTIQTEWGGEDADPSVLAGLIASKRREVEEKQTTLDSFSFREEDVNITEEVVREIESTIVGLNEERYRLLQLIEQLEGSLESDRIEFVPGDAESLFSEAGIVFPGQIVRDFEQLIEFNRAISRERREALEGELSDSQTRVVLIAEELTVLNAKRSASLEFLRESDSLSKYREVANELTGLKAALSTLEARKDAAERIVSLRREHRDLTEEFNRAQSRIETEIEEVSTDESSVLGQLRMYFDNITKEVVGRGAVLGVTVNQSGGLDFTAEFVTDSGTATSADRGTSYKRLLCIAFDLAMLRAHESEGFPRFVFHDGALETLEPRLREKLFGVFREYAGLGFQPIISLLDSDLPQPLDQSDETLKSDDIVLRLHDVDETGRLFKIDTW